MARDNPKRPVEQRAGAPLGDQHNFGRRVSFRDAVVYKPRALLWEWLLLGHDSPLREHLAASADREGLGRDAFAFLPTLAFDNQHNPTGGTVSQLELAPLERLYEARRGELARVTGRCIALLSWLGAADLHYENLVLGTNAAGQIVFGPVDVELIFGVLSLPTQTKLLPEADPEYAAICQHACGVRRVLPHLGKPIPLPLVAELAASYRATLDLLDRETQAIADIFAGQPRLSAMPIRVCLRSTHEYVLGDRDALWPPLLDAEREQLARGDIPYFFRLYGQRGIRYYTDAALAGSARLPLKGDVPQPDPILSLKRGLRDPSRTTLKEEGLLTVLAAFDHDGLQGEHATRGFEVAFRSRRIVVKLPNGEELRSPRDLREHVSSVYLACDCGEVRSVFVPARTQCKAAASS